ncbi:MAG: hypothetical protein NCW75_10880 [Phycisphaera sp.]|nr:MAG: hypothetical protein NCW75_10880 [Phycisphaera sp.]
MAALMATVLTSGCAHGEGRIKKFPPPAADVMPRRVMVVKHSEIDSSSNGYIDGVLVTVYFFNYDRPGPGEEQPFHRDGVLRFNLFGQGAEVLCEGEFDVQTMARSAVVRDIGPGYALLIDFGPRGYDDVRERLGARMDFEFVPSADPETRSFGSTQIRLGPLF